MATWKSVSKLKNSVGEERGFPYISRFCLVFRVRTILRGCKTTNYDTKADQNNKMTMQSFRICYYPIFPPSQPSQRSGSISTSSVSILESPSCNSTTKERNVSIDIAPEVSFPPFPPTERAIQCAKQVGPPDS